MSAPERLIEMLKRLPQAGGAARPGPQEENLRRLIRAAMPPAEVPESLRERVRALESAAVQPRRRDRPSPARLVWALAVSAAVISLAFSLLEPRWVAAQTLGRIQAAMDGVRSAHEVYWQISPNGRRDRAGETWFQDGRWRLVDFLHGGIDVFARGRLWTYDRKMNQVTVRRTSGPFGYNPSGFSLAAMKRDYARWGWRLQVQVLGTTSVGGRRARQVVIQRRDEERDLLDVDPATDLPIQSESQREVNGRWVTEFAAEYYFNEPLPAALFVPNFPAAAKYQDWDAGREAWQRRLAPGIARRRIDGRQIVIREVWVNAAGDVFALYTAENPPAGFYEDWRVELGDNWGTLYHEAAGLDPYNIETHPVRVQGSNLWWGFTFGGRKLRGKWWVPAISPRPWRPRRFTLTFYSAPKVGAKPPVRPGVKTPGERVQIARGTLALRVERAGPKLVPPFMPYMFDLMDAGQIEREEADARAAYLRRDPLQRYAPAQGPRRAQDLREALANYQKIVRMDAAQARQIGSMPHDPGVWTNMGKILYVLDRKKEACAAFERAIRESTENDWSRQEPQELLRGVHSVLAWTPGQPAPRVSGLDLEGQSHSVADYRGRVLLISLWSRFSHELPRIEELDTHYSREGLSILGVCVDINRKDLTQFVRAQRLPWPNLYDDKQYESEVAARFGYSWDFTRLPRTILVDRQGVVRAVDLHGPALDRAVAELLAEG